MASSYADAAACLAKVEKGVRSLKSAAYESRDPKKTYALCAEALKVRASLRAAIKATGLSAAVGKHDSRVLLLACYDAVAGRGLPKRAGGKLLRSIKERLEALKVAFEAHRATLPPAPQGEPRDARARATRYVRCNPLRGASRASVRAQLGGALAAKFEDDDLLDEVMRFPGALAGEFHGGHALVASGECILMDKASCFPAKALLGDLPSDWRGDVLDACAAPGNKTTHAAALLAGRGLVFALDRDARRLDILRGRAKQAGAAVAARHADFLEVTPASRPETAGVRAILLDPSCSGSGIVSLERAAMDTPKDDNEDRVAALADFQVSVLSHALSQFPNVDRVAYSTCSVHDAENEGVVARALAAHPDFGLEEALPRWHRRGRPGAGLSAADAAKVVRADPALDDTIGFFVALFTRRPSAKRPRDDEEEEAEAEEEKEASSSLRNARRKLKRRKKKRQAYLAAQAA